MIIILFKIRIKIIKWNASEVNVIYTATFLTVLDKTRFARIIWFEYTNVLVLHF